MARRAGSQPHAANAIELAGPLAATSSGQAHNTEVPRRMLEVFAQGFAHPVHAPLWNVAVSWVVLLSPLALITFKPARAKGLNTPDGLIERAFSCVVVLGAVFMLWAAAMSTHRHWAHDVLNNARAAGSESIRSLVPKQPNDLYDAGALRTSSALTDGARGATP